MRLFRTFAFAMLAITAGGAPAWAEPAVNAVPLTQHQLEQRYGDKPAQPYAMNYTDEVAQKLGVQDGKWEAFDTHSKDPLMPSLKGGVEHDKAMVSLQWRPGQ